MFVWASFLFLLAGVVASEFYGPGLRAVLTGFRLSPALTTILILAVGNGGVDMYATFAAVTSKAAATAVGQVVAAALFTATVGVGAVAAIAPFNVVRRAFVRDVLFFILATVGFIIIISDGNIGRLGAWVLIIVYALYTGAVALGGLIFGRDHEDEPNGGILHSDLEDAHEEDGLDGGHSARTPMLASVLNRYLPKESTRDGSVQPTGGSSSFADYGSTQTAAAVENQLFRSQNKSMFTAFAVREVLLRQEHGLGMGGATGLSGAGMNRVMFSHHTISEWLFPTLPPVADPMVWQAKSLYEKALAVLVAPAVLLVRLTIPVVFDQSADRERLGTVPAVVFGGYSKIPEADEDLLYEGGDMDEDLIGDWPSQQQRTSSERQRNQGVANDGLLGSGSASADDIMTPPKSLFIFECFWSAVLILMSFLRMTNWIHSLSVTFLEVLSIAAGFGGASAAVYAFKHSDTPRSTLSREYARWFTYLSLLTSVAWIYLLCMEILGVLGALGVIFDASKTMMGMTILAFGCLSGDFIANLTMAKAGFPSVAIRSSYATPLLNLTIGVGVAALYVIQFTTAVEGGRPASPDNPGPGALLLSPAIMVLAVGLLVVLVLSLIYIPLNGFEVDRRYGVALMVEFVIVMIAAMVVEGKAAYVDRHGT
ncbi:hypothetical protein HK102_002687 [Quaeritorhiza haematococci]|nr:hypothetical protein HK102_002687 [Quaeritorhiza haematococci]